MITYNTQEEYVAAREYRRTHKTNGISVEICNTFPFANEVCDDMRSAIEVYEFIHTPPDKYFLYINEKEMAAITWTGQKLGTVTFGCSYKSNMGDVRQPVSIWAINGKTYFGTYFKSSGNYARVKARKQ